MKTKLKRFTISVTPEMEADLDWVKQRLYYRSTQNNMIKDLIALGLAAVESEKAEKEGESMKIG